MEIQNECKWDTKEDDCAIENEVQEENDDDDDDEDDISSIDDDGYKSDEQENEYTRELDDNDFNVMLPRKEILFKKNEVEWLNEEEYLV